MTVFELPRDSGANSLLAEVHGDYGPHCARRGVVASTTRRLLLTIRECSASVFLDENDRYVITVVHSDREVVVPPEWHGWRRRELAADAEGRRRVTATKS